MGEVGDDVRFAKNFTPRAWNVAAAGFVACHSVMTL